MKRTIPVIAALLAAGLFAVNASAQAIPEGYGSSGASASANAAKLSLGPFVNASLQGPAATQSFDLSSACPGVTCTASSGDCECDTISGSLKGPGFGPVLMVLNLTLDDDDTTLVGSNGGRCFPGAGLATLTGPGADVAAISVIGALCFASVPGARSNGNFSYTQDPSLGESGKFLDAFGTGNLSIGTGSESRLPMAVYLAGTLQLHHGIVSSTAAR